jgi:hypothetical protein
MVAGFMRIPDIHSYVAYLTLEGTQLKSCTSLLLVLVMWLALVLGCSSSHPVNEKPVPPKQTLVSGFKAVPLTPTQYRLAREAVDSLQSMAKQYKEGSVTFESMQASTSRATDDVTKAEKSLPSGADITTLIKAAGSGYLHALMVWAALINYRGNGQYDRPAQREELAEVDRLFGTIGLSTKKKLEKILSLSITATDHAKEILDQAGQ